MGSLHIQGRAGVDTLACLLTFFAGLIVGLFLGTTIGVVTMAALAASSRNRTS